MGEAPPSSSREGIRPPQIAHLGGEPVRTVLENSILPEPQTPTRYDVNVQVRHGLSTFGARVDDDAVPCFKVILDRDQPDNLEEVNDQPIVFCAESIDTSDVLAGDHEQMYRRLRESVLDDKDRLILVDIFGRRFVPADTAEDAVLFVRAHHAATLPERTTRSPSK